MAGNRPTGVVGDDLRAWFAAAPPVAASPPLGWIRTIRTSAGMTQQELARRMGITAQSAFRLETNERNGTIRLDSLRRVGDALDCDVLYALVPRGRPAELEADSRPVTARTRPRPGPARGSKAEQAPSVGGPAPRRPRPTPPPV